MPCGCGEDELDECREADLEDRLTALESYRQKAEGKISDSDIRTLSKMGDETRFTILRILEAADSKLCFCELTPLLDVSESAVSHALSDLREADLIRRKKRGRWRYYELTDRAERILDALEVTR
ncbi:transcriptional regulator [Halobacteriales archaeon QS_5_68_33]|nr:MAG: transcriptional regulator [Halobacteriales archaeon QS_5_68_33]